MDHSQLLRAYAAGAATVICSEYLHESDSEDEDDNIVVGNFGLSMIQLRKRMNQRYRAMAILVREEIMKPGRGHIAFDLPKSPPMVGTGNFGIYHRMLNCPRKCIEVVGLSPKEFGYLLPHFEAAIMADPQFANFRAGKLPIEQRIMIVLHRHNSNASYREFEQIYELSKSCIQDDVLAMTPILNNVMKEALGNIFPNREQRNLLTSFLPEVLERLVVKPVVSLDHTKIDNIDSIDQVTGQTFFRGDKGMGPSTLIATDPTGRICYLEMGKPGNLADQTLYQQSSFFLDSMIDDDESAALDGGYTGPCTASPGASTMVQSFTSAAIAAMNPADRKLAKEFNKAIKSFRAPVEQAFGGCKKRGRDSAHRSSLYVYEDNVHMQNEFKFLMHIVKTHMRGQCFNGNPANLTLGRNGVNRVEWIISEYLQHGLLTVHGRKSMFYGMGLTGMGLDDQTPEVLDLF